MRVIQKGGDRGNMDAFRIGDHVIAADTEEDARQFYREEVEKVPPAVIEELSVSLEVPAGEGKTASIRDIMNRVLDERNSWLRMGVPCDLHFPFIVAKLK
jgi:alkanesulfonate monooxygenase SsuD/methylene tetrahydromethanopterin reductase-like flavin-dependent oxidoreductase (luciferase family)